VRDESGQEEEKSRRMRLMVRAARRTWRTMLEERRKRE
jgi:hypothetical protein